MRRILAPLVTLLVLAGVGVAIWLSASEQLALRRVVNVVGVIGSEKEEFFKDPAVVEALRQHGMVVRVEKAGSRQIATLPNLGQYDFAFPSSVAAGDHILKALGKRPSFRPFYSPMAIASWQPIAEILERNGLVQQRNGNWYWINLERYAEWAAAQRRWKELEGAEAYPVNKSVLIRSTDVRKSNSAAMYLSLMSFIQNGDQVVSSADEVAGVLPKLSPLFLRQGYTESSSEGPFEAYLSMGMGSAPLVMIYEAQFLARAAAKDASVRPEMVLIYPEPGILSWHVIVGISDAGARLGELLTTDPELKRLAHRHGFRTDDRAGFEQYLRDQGVPVPPELINVIDPPSYEMLEAMIQGIERLYQ